MLVVFTVCITEGDFTTFKWSSMTRISSEINFKGFIRNIVFYWLRMNLEIPPSMIIIGLQNVSDEFAFNI